MEGQVGSSEARAKAISRVLGPMQREILDVLEANLPEGYSPVGELKVALGRDRSNTRRAIRGLMRRGLVEEAQDEMGNRLIRLTDFGVLVSGAPLSIPKESATYPSRVWERWRPTVGRRPADGTSIRQNVLGIPSPSGSRAPGSIEQRILAVLRERSRPLDVSSKASEMYFRRVGRSGAPPTLCLANTSQGWSSFIDYRLRVQGLCRIVDMGFRVDLCLEAKIRSARF